MKVEIKPEATNERSEKKVETKLKKKKDLEGKLKQNQKNR